MRSVTVRRLSVLTLGAAGLAACGDQAVTDPARIPPSGRVPRASVADVGVIDLPVVEGRVIARFRSGADVGGEAAQHGASVDRALILSRTFALDVPVGQEADIARALAADVSVEFAEPDYLMAVEPCGLGLCDRPTDPFVGFKWDLNNNGTIKSSLDSLLQVTGTPDADIDWLEMFTALGPDFGGSATIGILDSGIRETHQDLAGRVVAARNFATGYPADLIEDRDGHGTHVSGIAAARANNARGVAGVAYAPNIKLINAKVCERYRFPDDSIRTACPTASSAEAIVWATDNGANVLNLSLGGPARATVGSAAQQAALQYARANNVLPFCAAGNENFNAVSFPGRFPECVPVAATNWDDARASYSNYAAEVRLAAPGGDGNPSRTPYSLILSADTVVNGYLWKAGTSMATPQVAGLAAMLYASGMTDDDEVLARLERTADDLGAAGRDPEFGFGRINAYRAVTEQDPIDPPIVEIFRQSATTARVGQPFYVFGRFTDAATDGPWTFRFDWGDGTAASGRVTDPPSETSLQTRAKAWSAPGVYTVRYTVRDGGGLPGYAERRVTVLP